MTHDFHESYEAKEFSKNRAQFAMHMKRGPVCSKEGPVCYSSEKTTKFKFKNFIKVDTWVNYIFITFTNKN